MGILKRITAALGRATSRIKKVFQRRPAPMPQPQTKGQARQAAREKAEDRATKQALWAIQNAAEHPEDRTAQAGRKKAVEYLSRAERLKGKGKLQDANRQRMAERWLESDLSNASGQQDRKARRLQTFNENFNMDLNEDQAKIVTDLMESDSYNKLIETYRGIYRELISAIGEAVANNIDPLNIEKALTLFQENELQPDFDTFSKVLDLSDEDFNVLAAEMDFYTAESIQRDERQAQDDKDAILGRYINWE